MRSSLLNTLLPCCFSNPYTSADAYLQPLTTMRPGGGGGGLGGGVGGGGLSSSGGGNRPPPSLEELLDASAAAREATWRSLGALEPLALSQHPAGPAAGGPKWPAGRCAFRMVRRSNGNILLASDGLSDPFDDLTLGDGNVNGFGLEFYIEAPASEFGDAADAAAAGFGGGGPSTSGFSASSGSGPTLHAAKASWQFQLLYTVAQLAAGHGGIRAIMDEMRLLSTEAEGVAGAMPASASNPSSSSFPGNNPSSSPNGSNSNSNNAVVTPAGRVGALLGLRADALAGGAESAGRAPPPPDRIPGMPLTDVLLVNVKLLTLGELGLITERGAAGRAALDEAFRGAGRLVSSLSRPSVV